MAVHLAGRKHRNAAAAKRPRAEADLAALRARGIVPATHLGSPGAPPHAPPHANAPPAAPVALATDGAAGAPLVRVPRPGYCELCECEAGDANMEAHVAGRAHQRKLHPPPEPPANDGFKVISCRGEFNESAMPAVLAHFDGDVAQATEAVARGTLPAELLAELQPAALGLEFVPPPGTSTATAIAALRGRHDAIRNVKLHQVPTAVDDDVLCAVAENCPRIEHLKLEKCSAVGDRGLAPRIAPPCGSFGSPDAPRSPTPRCRWPRVGRICTFSTSPAAWRSRTQAFVVCSSPVAG
jgi:hypothetical protein